MKTLLLTGYNDAYARLAELTTPLMLRYARRHGYDFKCFHSAAGGVETSWRKVSETIVALLHYDRVLWLDVDQVVTNPDVTHDQDHGLHVSQDWGPDATSPAHFSAGCYLACRDVAPLFENLLDSRAESLARDEWEQTPMRKMFDYRWIITVHPRRTFNAVPIEVCPDVVEPWQPGDWCAHLTMVSLEERLRIFAKIKYLARL